VTAAETYVFKEKKRKMSLVVPR